MSKEKGILDDIVEEERNKDRSYWQEVIFIVIAIPLILYTCL